jgi:WD40 repeat protein
VLFTPDGLTLVTAGYDGRICFWEYPALRLISEISLPGESFVSLTIRSDGQMLAATTVRLRAYVWQMNSRQLLAQIPGEWNCVAFAPSGPNLALCGGRIWGDGAGPLLIWDSNRRQEVRTWPLAGSRVDWAPDGKQLFTGPFKDGLACCNLETGSCERVYNAERRVLSIAYSPDGKILAVSSTATSNPIHTIRLWEMVSGKLIAELPGHTANIWKLCFSPDGRYLASASSDQSIRIWEVSTARLYASLRGHGDEAWSVAFAPDGRNLASVDKQGMLLWWALPPAPQEPINSQVSSIVGPRIYSPDNQTMAVGIGKDRVALIDLPTQQLRKVIDGATSAIRFEDNGRSLITLNSAGLSRIQLPRGETSALRPLSPPLQNFEIFGLSRDHRLLAAENQPGRICLWDLELGQVIDSATLPQGRRVVYWKFSPDGKQLAVTREESEQILLYSDGFKHLRLFKKHTLPVWSVDFTSDSRLMASASMDDKVMLWNVETGELVATLTGHKEGVAGVAFSPSDRTLAALCGNRTIKLWNVPTQREVGNLSFDRISAYVEFAPDGQTLIAFKPWAPDPRFEFWRGQVTP